MKTSILVMVASLGAANLLMTLGASPTGQRSAALQGVGGLIGTNGLETTSFVANREALVRVTETSVAAPDELVVDEAIQGVGGLIGNNGLETRTFAINRDALLWATTRALGTSR